MKSKSESKVRPFRGKACWRITYVPSGKVEYTRDIDYIKTLKNNRMFACGLVDVDFISNTPPAIEVLYFGATSE